MKDKKAAKLILKRAKKNPLLCSAADLFYAKKVKNLIKNISVMKQSPRQLKEAHKAYEKVVNYLVNENYASNKQDADAIIGGMSEEWYHMILNESVSW